MLRYLSEHGLNTEIIHRKSGPAKLSETILHKASLTIATYVRLRNESPMVVNLDHIPINEYLATSYRPDREYMEGLVLERNLGQSLSSLLQIPALLYS
jgi:hypothetical protein